MKNILTVIVPLYNQERYIRKCLDSILRQTIEGLSVIVVNDGSVDRSLEICEEISKKDSRLIIVNQENRGLAGARYAGIEMAQSEYVTFVDADDFILENAYDDALQYMRNNIDVIFYEISRYYSEEEIKHEHHIIDIGIFDRQRIEKEVFPKMIWDFERKVPGIECSQCVRIIKKDILENMYSNLQKNRFYYGEDIAITYPSFTCVETMAVIPKSYYMHRQRSKGEIPGYIFSDGYFDEVFSLFRYLRKRMKLISSFDFNKQIDYLYMYSVNLKRMCYNDYFYKREYLFPFGKVGRGSTIVLYGAGSMGQSFYSQLERTGYCNCVLWVDKNSSSICDDRVRSTEELKKQNVNDFEMVVIAIESSIVVKEVNSFLKEIGFSEEKIVKG